MLPDHLAYLLSMKRPAGGIGWSLATKYVEGVIEDAGYDCIRDDMGNVICTTEYNGVLFSCHLDTVHDTDGLLDVEIDDFGIVTAYHTVQGAISGMSKELQEKRERCVLGADDAAGAYIMLKMIENNYPGTYVFHAAEEIGCLGSKALADTPYSLNGYDLKEDITHAVAFDRKGTSDFIWSQLGERMCSPECSAELISRLSALGLNYRKEYGLVTDTAMYADQVEECINLSVGYYDEHTSKERLDFGHVELLLATILANREMFADLPAVRDVSEVVDVSPWDDEDGYDYYTPAYGVPKDDTILALVETYPDAVADILEQLGYDYNNLFATINQVYYG